MRLRTFIALMMLGLIANPLWAQNQTYVFETVHNLSIFGPGEIRALSEEEVCVFCHTPHGAFPMAALWNRETTQAVFDPYPISGSLQEEPSSPTGSSLVCLSCHDGTLGMGNVLSRPMTISLVGTEPGGTMITRSLVGTYLADDHPVAFVPDLSNPEIVLPPPGDPVRLSSNGEVHCRSCHDPHSNRYSDFLVEENNQGAICITCHALTDWNVSVHGHPKEAQYKQLEDQACSSCHDIHAAPSPGRLLLAEEEALCFRCHDGIRNDTGEVACVYNLEVEFDKTSHHPIELNPGVHDPDEAPQYSAPTPYRIVPEINPNALRHVECVDCHNPHSVNPYRGASGIKGNLNNIMGVGANGQKAEPAQKEFELCYKCHSESANLPNGSTNKRSEFSLSNASFHPVEGIGRNKDVPSLKPPWTVESILKCTDCHGNDNPEGPVGPHGSNNPSLLVRYYNTEDNIMDSQNEYALCYGCHDRSILISPPFQLGFSEHRRHIVDGNTPCIACHDVHGTEDYTHLIVFNPEIVTISPTRITEFIDLGTGTGECFLTCHGKNHDPEVYP